MTTAMTIATSDCTLVDTPESAAQLRCHACVFCNAKEETASASPRLSVQSVIKHATPTPTAPTRVLTSP